MEKEELVAVFCDEYCHWPFVCSQDELDERCEKCVMNQLLEEDT